MILAGTRLERYMELPHSITYTKLNKQIELLMSYQSCIQHEREMIYIDHNFSSDDSSDESDN